MDEPVHDTQTGTFPGCTQKKSEHLTTGMFPIVGVDMSWPNHEKRISTKIWKRQYYRSPRRFEIISPRGHGNVQMTTARRRNAKDLHVVQTIEHG